jgi:hypothetical protein
MKLINWWLDRGELQSTKQEVELKYASKTDVRSISFLPDKNTYLNKRDQNEDDHKRKIDDLTSKTFNSSSTSSFTSSLSFFHFIHQPLPSLLLSASFNSSSTSSFTSSLSFFQLIHHQPLPLLLLSASFYSFIFPHFFSQLLSIDSSSASSFYFFSQLLSIHSSSLTSSLSFF